MIIQEAKDLIKRWEGLKLKAYLCPAGKPTIGYGHTNGVSLGMVITEEEADKLLDEDIAYFTKEVKRLVKVDLNEYQLGALVSFTFNLGVGNLKKSTLLKRLNEGKYEAVPEQLMRWVKAKSPVTGILMTLPGLVNRRAAEAGLWARTSFVSSAEQEAKPAGKEIPWKDVAGAVLGGGGSIASAVSGNVILSAAIAVTLVALVGFFIWQRMKDD